jgi:hypothetical protein
MNKFVKNRKQLLDLEHKNVFTITDYCVNIFKSGII